MKPKKSLPKKVKRKYKKPRKRRDPRCMDPLYDITYFETGKRKKCYACPDLVFVSDVDYLFHLEEAHDGQRMHCCICSQCGKTFGSISELHHHTISKCGTNPSYACAICGKKLMSAGSLYTHMLLHGDCNYTCNFCGKQFHNVHHLKAHERIHTKAALYTCEVCGKSFAHRQSIITHSSLHTGIKPYSCEHCGKGFSCISNLLKHRKTHATTCGALPLTSHRVKNAETKLRIRMNTPATVKQKNYSKYKLNELNEKQTINAVRRLSKKKHLLMDIIDVEVQSDDDGDDNYEKDIKQTEITEADVPNKVLKNKRTTNSFDDDVSYAVDIDIIKHEIDVKPSVDLNISQDTDKYSTIKPSVILKEELHLDSDFDLEDSIPLSAYLASFKSEIIETIASITANKIDAIDDGNSSKIMTLNDNYDINVNNQNIVCTICTLTFQSKEDFDMHVKIHSISKLSIGYMDDFDEADNDFGDYKDDDSLGNDISMLMVSEQSEPYVSKKSRKRKLPPTSLVKVDKFLVKIQKPSRTRKRKTDPKLNLENNKVKQGREIKKRRSTRMRTNNKEFKNQSEQQECDLIKIEVKKEVQSDLEESSGKHRDNRNLSSSASELIDSFVQYNNKNRFECKVCGRVFKHQKSLRKHQLGRGYKNILGEQCAGFRSKALNQQDMSPQTEFKDDDSASLDNIPLMSRSLQKKPVSSKIKIKQSREQHKFICSICGTILKYEKWMQKHQMGTGFRNEAGEECAGPSLGRPHLTDGDPTENGSDMIYVAKGHATVANKTMYPNYKQFMKTRKENRKVQCEFCNRTFSRMYLLKKHQNSKLNKDLSSSSCATLGSQTIKKCSYCPLYLEKKLMKEHKKSVHADILQCDICNNIFSKPETLRYHRMAKHKLLLNSPDSVAKRNYVYVCDKCGAQYKHKSSLSEHERTGCSSGPLFKCDHCNARLHNVYTLKTHMAKHVEEKRHLCTFCGMKFMMKVQLKNHLYTHTGEKPFKCQFCPKAFAHSTSLDTHTSTHTGIKRYICLACGKRFSCYGNLDKHKASKSCKEWYNLNEEKKKMNILDEKPIFNITSLF